MFQQETASFPHSSILPKSDRENFHDQVTPKMLPPSSPDLNPLDYNSWRCHQEFGQPVAPQHL